MATIDPITGLPSSNVQKVYPGDKPISSVPAPTPSVDASKIGTTTATPVPSPTTPTINPNQASQMANYVGSSAQTAEQQALQQAQMEAEARKASTQAMMTDYAQSQALLGGKQGDLATAYSTKDATGQSVNDLAAQLRQLNAQAQGLQLDTLAKQQGEINKATGQNITQAAVARNTADATRENLINMATIGIKTAIAKADYETAKSYADQMVEAKYSQMEANLKSKEIQLKWAMEQDLAPAQKKLADAQARQIEAQKQEMADKKANEKIIGETLAKVGTYRDLKGNPAPQSVLEHIKNTTDPITATLLSLPYLNDPLERQKKIEDIANARAKASKEGVTSASLAKNMPNQALIDAINNGKIDPNKVNSRTIGIFNTLANAQVDAVGSSAGSQARTAAVKTIYGQVSQARRVTAVLDKNMPLLYDLADKVNTTNTPALDRIIAGAQTYTGNNPDVIRYVNTIKTIRSEYAQMLARGGEVTESQRDDAAQAIPTGLSGQGYKEIGAQLQAETKNIIDAGNETYTAVLNPSSVPTHQGYALPTSGNGSYKGYTLPH